MFDCSGRLRPAAFMDIAQEVAALDSERNGFADGDLKKHGLVWILARMNVRYDKMPVRLDTVTAQTWHRGLDGVFFRRDYRLLDSMGEPAVSATSEWVIMDIESRRLVRSDKVTDLIPAQTQADESALDTGTGKLRIDGSLVLARVTTHRVVYSDLDYNGHVNNAKYTVWAMDTLPPEVTGHRSPREIRINFSREALPGTEVELFCGQKGDTYSVEGRIAGEQSFITEIIF